MSEQEFAVRVNDQLKSTELRLCGALGRDKRHGAHMRAFWASTVSFFVAFVGWFALSPIAIEVVHSIDACENQLFPPVANPERKAFLKFKAIASGKKYCQHGKIGEDNDPTGCQDVPQDVWDESWGTVADNFEVLPKCVCSPGTHCGSTILYSSITSVGITIFVRVALGTLLERFGPVNVQSGLLLFGAIWVFAAAGISAEWNFILIQGVEWPDGSCSMPESWPLIVGTESRVCAERAHIGHDIAATATGKRARTAHATNQVLCEAFSAERADRVTMAEINVTEVFTNDDGCSQERAEKTLNALVKEWGQQLADGLAEKMDTPCQDRVLHEDLWYFGPDPRAPPFRKRQLTDLREELHRSQRVELQEDADTLNANYARPTDHSAMDDIKQATACSAAEGRLRAAGFDFNKPPDTHTTPRSSIAILAGIAGPSAIDKMKTDDLARRAPADIERKLNAMPNYALQGILRELKLPVSGIKVDLVARIVNHYNRGWDLSRFNVSTRQCFFDSGGRRIRMMIGCAGATFVTNQFWCSLMFAPNVVGTANATAAGWGNLGGGVTQIFIVWCLFKPFQEMGASSDTAWRLSMVVPGCVFVAVAISMKLFCWDMPTGPRFKTSDTGKTSNASMWDYVECLKDPRIVIMIFQYGACFGTELVMNAQLATHFRVYFQMEAGAASALAGSFGLMNLFARSLGGIFSDFLFARFGFSGRIWAQFLCLFLEGIFLLGFGSVENSQPWYVALAVLLCFSLFVQMTEGTSYGIVPFMNPKQLACTSALVGAGGNLGAVIALWCFYNTLGPIDTLLPFKVHGAYVIFWAMTSPAFYWADKGGMFCGASDPAFQKPAPKELCATTKDADDQQVTNFYIQSVAPADGTSNARAWWTRTRTARTLRYAQDGWTNLRRSSAEFLEANEAAAEQAPQHEHFLNFGNCFEWQTTNRRTRMHDVVPLIWAAVVLAVRADPPVCSVGKLEALVRQSILAAATAGDLKEVPGSRTARAPSLAVGGMGSQAGQSGAERSEGRAVNADAAERSGAAHVYRVRAVDNGHVSADVSRGGREEGLTKAAGLMKDHPTVPSVSVYGETLEGECIFSRGAVELPRAHCAFRGCGWRGSSEAELRAHVLGEHREALRHVAETLACHDEDEAKRSETQCWSAYNEAIAWKVREGAPLASLAIDRRCLREYARSLGEDAVHSLVCMVCARKFPRVEGRKGNPIEWRAVTASGGGFFGLPDAFVRDNVTVDSYLERIGEVDGAGEGSSGVHLRDRMDEFEDWHVCVPSGDGPMRVLCCPEDMRCHSGTTHAVNSACAGCEAPLCGECGNAMAGPDGVREAADILESTKTNAVVCEKSSFDEGDINAQRIEAVRTFVQRLDEECAHGDANGTSDSSEEEGGDGTTERARKRVRVREGAGPGAEQTSREAAERVMLEQTTTEGKRVDRLRVRTGNVMMDQFEPWGNGAPRVELPLWVRIMSRRVESQLCRDWHFGFVSWNLVFRSAVNLSRTWFTYVAPSATGEVEQLTPEQIGEGAKQIYRALDMKYVDINGRKQKVKGDMTKVRHMPNLGKAAHKLLTHIEHTSRRLPGTQEARRVMRFETNALRVRYGVPIFVTLSPDEGHNLLMLRLSRTRRQDPVHAAAEDQAQSRVAGDREWPRVAPDVDEARLGLPMDAARAGVPSWAERRRLLARDPMASVDGFRIIVDATLRHLFGLRTCPNCPRCNHAQESGDLYGFLPIAEGMPVALTDHIDRSEDKNLLRGRVGRVQSWVCDGDAEHDQATRVGETILKKTPKVIFVLFDEGDDGKGGRKPCKWTIGGLRTPGLHPVGPQKKEWFVDEGRPHPRLKGQTFKEGVIVDLSIGGGTSPLSSYVALTRVQRREDMLIFRPFDIAPYQKKDERKGPGLLLRTLRGEDLDWEAIELEFMPSGRCAVCGCTKYKNMYPTVGQWSRADGLRVCSVCLEDKKRSGTPWQCMECGLWKCQEAFHASQHHPSKLTTRRCVDCPERRSCRVCDGRKYEEAFAPYQWDLAGNSRCRGGMCKECEELKTHLTCSRCGMEKLVDDFARIERNAEERKCKACKKSMREEERQRAEEGKRRVCSKCGESKSKAEFSAHMWCIASKETIACTQCVQDAAAQRDSAARKDVKACGVCEVAQRRDFFSQKMRNGVADRDRKCMRCVSAGAAQRNTDARKDVRACVVCEVAQRREYFSNWMWECAGDQHRKCKRCIDGAKLERGKWKCVECKGAFGREHYSNWSAGRSTQKANGKQRCNICCAGQERKRKE
ncbi:unnamed protein product, partial [Prorocentrum cordatum]